MALCASNHIYAVGSRTNNVAAPWSYNTLCQSNLLNMLMFYDILYFSDIEIARAQIPKDISYLAHEIGLLPKEISLYGNKKAKISLSVLKRLFNQKDGKYVVVAG